MWWIDMFCEIIVSKFCEFDEKSYFLVHKRNHRGGGDFLLNSSAFTLRGSTFSFVIGRVLLRSPPLTMSLVFVFRLLLLQTLPWMALRLIHDFGRLHLGCGLRLHLHVVSILPYPNSPVYGLCLLLLDSHIEPVVGLRSKTRAMYDEVKAGWRSAKTESEYRGGGRGSVEHEGVSGRSSLESLEEAERHRWSRARKEKDAVDNPEARRRLRGGSKGVEASSAVDGFGRPWTSERERERERD
ncbi:hypothetical protein TIFTF001_052949 [Ficus carica]|uniref:Uncharacterized protein n=1 Tax=Ficus carica TaxID=3494 RepID=A0AA88JG97_FICCA|nr:hypothetical protein TIFTF001_052949 [Ficus carica]